MASHAGNHKNASRCTRSVASDAGNQGPEQVCKKGRSEKLARRAFHVINVTLLGSRGTSSANSLPSSSPRVSIPRFAQFREDSNLKSCTNFQRKPQRTKQFPASQGGIGICILILSRPSQKSCTISEHILVVSENMGGLVRTVLKQ